MKNKGIILGIITSVIFISCRSGNNNDCEQIPNLFEGKDISSGLLDKYMQSTSTFTLSNNNLNEEVRIYVDKSSGINEAFSSPIGGDKAKSLLLEIAGQKNLKYYSVLKDIKQEVIEGSPTNYYDKKENYNPLESAALEKALNEITNNNGLSFFVTDGEEFDALGEEDNDRPWAQAPMEKWINQGNSIHFWITDFDVAFKAKGPKKIKKHLFFMAFVPSRLAIEKPFLDLVKSLNDKNVTHLELSNSSWVIHKPEWSQQSTGIDANLLMDGVFEKSNYIRKFDNSSGSYEFISIQLPIKSDVLTVEGALTKPQFYRDLFIDLSNNKFFEIIKLDIDVTEISKDINSFYKFEEITLNKPNTTKDSNTQQTILDPANNFSCYYEIKDDKPSLKINNQYIKKYDASLKELFQFDDEIFKNSMKDNSSKVELGLRFHKDFNENDPKLKSDLSYNIIRVDFKIAVFQNKTVSEYSNFTWDSMWKLKEQNSGFGKSLLQVIQSTQPTGKVIHTLFIKFIKDP